MTVSIHVYASIKFCRVILVLRIQISHKFNKNRRSEKQEPNFIVGPNYKLLPEKVNKEKKPLSVADSLPSRALTCLKGTWLSVVSNQFLTVHWKTKPFLCKWEKPGLLLYTKINISKCP